MPYKDKEKQRAYYQAYDQAHREEKRAYNQAHREQERSHQLKHNYGITWEDKVELYLKQCGRCAICGKVWEGITTDVCVDHCHRRNVVRGLLCRRCNTKLGNIEDYMYDLDGNKSKINQFLMKGMDS